MIHNFIILAADFSPIKPDFGLIVWTTLFFGLFWWLIGKNAFRPIATALKERSNSIDEALRSAEKAREEMAQLKSENDLILREAREERSKIIKEANEVKSKIIAEAREEAKEEASRMIEDAKHEITSQKNAALHEVKSEVGNIAIEIAEQVLKRELNEKQEQEKLVESLVGDIKFSSN